MAGPHDGARAPGDGEGTGTGVVLAGSGPSVAGRVVTESAEHPGAGDDPQAGPAGPDLGVPSRNPRPGLLGLGHLPGVRLERRTEEAATVP